jgi:hypothetical protein
MRSSNLLNSGSTSAQLPRSALAGTNFRGEWTGKLLNGSKLIGISRRFGRAKSNETAGRMQPGRRRKQVSFRLGSFVRELRSWKNRFGTKEERCVADNEFEDGAETGLKQVS